MAAKKSPVARFKEIVARDAVRRKKGLPASKEYEKAMRGIGRGIARTANRRKRR